MGRGGDRSAQAIANGKKLGRPAKAKLEVVPSKDIASAVFAKVDEVALHLEFLHADRPLKDLSDVERKERERELDRLTNRKYGQPAQSVFAGDTRETSVPLTYGNMPRSIPADAAGAGKPN